MIRAEKENNKMRVSLDGDSHDLIAEFFSIVNHVAEMCAETCFPEYREEFMKEFLKDINDVVKSAMNKTNKTKELIEEYAAITKCIAKVFVNSCIPGKLEELKRELYKEMIRFTDEAFAEAEKAKDKEGEAWHNL